MASSRMPVTSLSVSSGPAMDEHLLHDWSALVQASLSCFLQERLACAICERLTRDTRLAKIFQGCSCLRCHESVAFQHETRSKSHTAVFVNGRPDRRDARVSTSPTSFTVRAFLIATWRCRWALRIPSCTRSLQPDLLESVQSEVALQVRKYG